MKSLYTLLFCCLWSLNAKAQNLVPNCSFENYTTCPVLPGDVNKIIGWDIYNYASPDYVNSCSGGATLGVPLNAWGNQAAASGNAYIGLIAVSPNDYCEMVHAGITPMIPGTLYDVSMYVSLADNCLLGSDGLGIYFFDNGAFPLTSSTILPITPQISFTALGAQTDQTNWARLSGQFIADSAYDNIVIGGWVPYASTITAAGSSPSASASMTGYYYIDSVVVMPVTDILFTYTETDKCGGDNISIPFTVSAGYTFNSSNVFTLQLSNATGSFASPTTLGTYAGTTSGTINATIPATASGTGYRIRIVSSSPADSSDISTADIRITPPHTITASSNAPLCEGDTLFLNSSASTSGVSYLWNGPGSFSDLNQNTYITPVSTSQSGKYAITTLHNACIATDTADVVVKPKPVVTASSNSPVCPGTTMQLNATSSITGSSFSWAGPNSFSSTLQNPVRNAVAYADQGTYTVTVTKDGCSVEQNVPVTVQITTATPLAGSNSPVCEGFPLNLTALSATPGVTYSWAGPLGYTSTQQNPTQAATTSHTGDFIVKAILNGCVSLPDTVNVQVLPKPYLGSYASPNDTVCEGTVVTFVTVPMSGIINPTFQWFKNNTLVPGATNLTLISPYATGDTFYCRTFCQNQCGDNLTLYSNKVGMTVMPMVNNLSVTLSSVPAQPLPGNPVAFTATVVSGGYSPQYQWKKNGSDIFGATSAIYNANNLAPYDKITCCVITSDPCANPTTACSDAMIVNFPTSVGEINNDEVFQLYPNPNDGSFKVKMQNVKCKSIDVVNVSGQVVYQLKTDAPQSEYTMHMPQQLPSGTYMLRVYDGEQSYRKSFTVSK